MDKEMLDILKDLSKKPTTELALQIMELSSENLILEQQVKKQKEVIDKIKKHCEIEINASNHYLRNHSSQQELCHKVAHQRILDILKEVSK